MTKLVNQKCICDTKQKFYSEAFDTLYCESCNTWLEDKCDDINCEYCINRPVFPNDYYPFQVNKGVES